MLPSKNGIATDFKIIFKEKSCGKVSLAGFCMKWTYGMKKKKGTRFIPFFFTVSICGEWAVKIHVCVLLIIIFLAGGNTGVLVYFFLKKSLLWLVHDASLFITSVLPGLLFLLLVVSCLATWAKSSAVSVWCTDCWNFVMFVT